MSVGKTPHPPDRHGLKAILTQRTRSLNDHVGSDQDGRTRTSWAARSVARRPSPPSSSYPRRSPRAETSRRSSVRKREGTQALRTPLSRTRSGAGPSSPYPPALAGSRRTTAMRSAARPGPEPAWRSRTRSRSRPLDQPETPARPDPALGRPPRSPAGCARQTFGWPRRDREDRRGTRPSTIQERPPSTAGGASCRDPNPERRGR